VKKWKFMCRKEENVFTKPFAGSAKFSPSRTMEMRKKIK
jgi:hypothetical protein